MECGECGSDRLASKFALDEHFAFRVTPHQPKVTLQLPSGGVPILPTPQAACSSLGASYCCLRM